MGYFQVRYDSRVIIYDRRGFIRLANEAISFYFMNVEVFTNPNFLIDGGVKDSVKVSFRHCRQIQERKNLTVLFGSLTPRVCVLLLCEIF